MSASAVEPGLDWRGIWREFGDYYVERLRSQTAVNIERELLFCLLGGHGVSFELAWSATDALDPVGVFSPAWDPARLESTIRATLDQPQFEPRRRDGSLRRFRYPARKARLIAQAACWLRSSPPLHESLVAIADERDRRSHLCGCPGIGLKTASWLLRNTGLADQLAVVDIHVLRALVDAGLVEDVKLPRDYLAVEARFLAWCAELEAPPAAFDLLLWEWQRSI